MKCKKHVQNIFERNILSALLVFLCELVSGPVSARARAQLRGNIARHHRLFLILGCLSPPFGMDSQVRYASCLGTTHGCVTLLFSAYCCVSTAVPLSRFLHSFSLFE